jgi:hypothetical protein
LICFRTLGDHQETLSPSSSRWTCIITTFTTYTGELNQIWEQDNNTLIFGARFQSGEFHTSDRLDTCIPPIPSFSSTCPGGARFLLRSNGKLYIYDTWRRFALCLSRAGSYDRLEFPTNYRNAPIVAAKIPRSAFTEG